jgi:hypothetical protein
MNKTQLVCSIIPTILGMFDDKVYIDLDFSKEGFNFQPTVSIDFYDCESRAFICTVLTYNYSQVFYVGNDLAFTHPEMEEQYSSIDDVVIRLKEFINEHFNNVL